MFAPRYHPAMKAVAPVRKALKIKTAFNILGPMLNPSRAPYSIVGVYHENLVSLTPFHYLVMKLPCLLYAHSPSSHDEEEGLDLHLMKMLALDPFWLQDVILH